MKNLINQMSVGTELKLLDFARDAIIMVNHAGIITYWNEGALELYGWSKEEAIGRDYRDLLQKGNLPALVDFPVTPSQAGSWEGELTQVRRDGKSVIVASRWTVDYDIGGQISEILQINRDITMAKKREEELIHQAFYDPLTDLPNRALFMDRLARTVAMAKRHHDYKFALVFIDLDHFKSVNDTFGHITGDHLLTAMGKRLFNCLRENDTIARLGGDEFAIILDDIKINDYATGVAARLQEQFKMPFVLGEHIIQSTASMGIVLSTNDQCPLEKIIQQADTALYRAKKLGKARCELSL